MADARVRRATVEDVSGIRAVLAETWRDTYGAFVPLDAIERTTAVWHAPSVLTDEIVHASTFVGVAEDDSGTVGMVSAHDRGDAIEVARLYVVPSAQRRGVGRRLLAAALAAFPDRRLVRLEVEAQNPKGRAFYAKVGFVARGDRTIEAFGTTLRVIVMELRVSEPGDGSP